jgi:hypothetical protein
MYANELNNKENFEVTAVAPQYDHKHLMGGHFDVTFGIDDPVKYKLNFGSLIAFLFKNDPKLKKYVVDTMERDETGIASFSDVISDLYSIDFPVEAKVKEYVDYVRDRLTEESFNSMLILFKMLKGFNEDESPNL